MVSLLQQLISVKGISSESEWAFGYHIFNMLRAVGELLEEFKELVRKDGKRVIADLLQRGRFSIDAKKELSDKMDVKL